MDKALHDIARHRAVQLLAQGNSKAEVSRILTEEGVPVSRSTISRVQKNNAEAIQKEAQKVVDKLPDIITADLKHIETAGKLTDYFSTPMPAEGEPDTVKNPTRFMADKNALKFMELGQKKAEGYLKAIGMLPTNSVSIVFNQLILNQAGSVIAPAIMAILGGRINSLTDEPEPIDV